MGLIPMEFSAVDFTVREPHQRHPLEFPPTTSAEPKLEILPLADREVSGDRLDVPDIAEEVEIQLHESSLTASRLARKLDLTLGISSKRCGRLRSVCASP